jgi:hypothetical protein
VIRRLGLYPQIVQQAFEETLRGRAIPPLLHQDVQHHAVLVHRPPQVVQHASEPDEYLVEVPRITRPRSPAAEPTGKIGTELAAPVSNALAGDDHAALGQDQLDVSQAEAEHVVQPNGVVDDLGREPMPRVRGG